VTTFPLRRLRLRPGEEYRDGIAVQLEPFVLGGERYLPVRDKPDVELTVSRATSGDVFRLRFETRIHGPCMRCLEDAVLDVAIDAQEYNAADGAAATELRSDYVLDDQLLLSTWARDAIALRLPDQIVCRVDCAGLCHVCGKDLNREPHSHEDDVADSRWAALASLKDELDDAQ
jgi:uncharacterized protein